MDAMATREVACEPGLGSAGAVDPKQAGKNV